MTSGECVQSLAGDITSYEYSFSGVLMCACVCNRMLVNMGDLPQPENDVLSQTVWSPLERGISTGSIGGASLPGGVKQQEYTTVTSTPSMPPSSSRTVGPEGGGDAPSQSSNRTSSKRTEEVAAVVGGEDAHNSKRAKF